MYSGLGTKLCLTFSNPKDCSPPGFSVLGVSQARLLEWVAISFSRGSSQSRVQMCISCIVGGSSTAEPSCENKKLRTWYMPSFYIVFRAPTVCQMLVQRKLNALQILRNFRVFHSYTCLCACPASSSDWNLSLHDPSQKTSLLTPVCCVHVCVHVCVCMYVWSLELIVGKILRALL